MPNDFLDDGIAALPAHVVFADAAAARAAGDSDAPSAPIATEALLNVPGASSQIADATAAYRASAEYQADRRRAAEQEAQERHAAMIDSRVSALLDAPVPDDAALGTDTSMFGPRRSEHVRFVEHLRQLRQQRDQAECGRAEYLAAIGVPAQVEQRIENLISEDRNALAQWIRSGADKLLKPLLRQAEREQLTQALATSQHEAQVAGEAISQIEDEIEVLNRVIAGLEGRTVGFAQNALVETATEADREFRDARDAMRRAMVQLRAVESVVGTGRAALRDLYAFSAGMPVLPGPLVIGEREISAAAAPWRDRLRRLIADPKADFSDDVDSRDGAES